MPAKTKPTKNKITQIGAEKVYESTGQLAGEVMAVVRQNMLDSTDHKRVALVVGQPQSGKTGIIIAVIDQIIDYCTKKKLTFQITVLCGLSSLELVRQTKNRINMHCSENGKLTGAWLNSKALNSRLCRLPEPYMGEGILVLNNSQKLKDTDLTSVPVDVRFTFLDECHVGNITDGCLDQFFLTHGIDIKKQMHAWPTSNTQNHLILFSATPFAHLIYSKEFPISGEALFTTVYRTPPKTYNSLKKMRTNGRLREVEKDLIHHGQPTVFFNRVLSDFDRDCQLNGPGYLVLRATGKKNEDLMEYINSNSKIECLAFDGEKDNIGELNDTLSQWPRVPTLVVIRGSMRAGITLKERHYVRAWVESASQGRDVQAQAGAGRACGYGRGGDTYPIYCDLPAVDEVIKMYDELDAKRLTAVPAGLQNVGTNSRSGRPRYTYRISGLLDYDKAEAKRRKMRGAKNTGNVAQISSTSGNIVVPVADLLMQGIGVAKRDNGSVIGYHVDGPPTREAVEKAFTKKRTKAGSRAKLATVEARDAHHAALVASYNRLVSIHPDWVGKVVMLDVENPIDDRDLLTRDDLQKPKSALRRVV